MEEAQEIKRRKLIEATVIYILKAANLETTSEHDIRTVAAERLGVDRFDLDHKRLIRGVIESFLLSTTTSEGKNGDGCDKVQKLQAAQEDIVMAAPTVQQQNGGVGSFQNNNGRIICKLSEKRNVSVHDFRGQYMVSIRDYNLRDGKLFHSARGISLTAKQWSSFRNNIPAIEESITKMKSHIQLQAANKQSETDVSSSVVDSAKRDVASGSKQMEADLLNPNFIAIPEESDPEGRKQIEVNSCSSTTPNPQHQTPANNVQLPITNSVSPPSTFSFSGHLQHDKPTGFPLPRLVHSDPIRLDGKNYYFWKHQMEFSLAKLKIAYVLTEPCPSKAPTPPVRFEEIVQKPDAIQKWVRDDCICRHNILSSLCDSLYNEYSGKACSAKELWEELKYVYDEDYGTRRSEINKYIQFRMVDGVSILHQVQELHNILNSIMESGIWIEEYFHVSVIIAKLPPSWKEFRLRLMREEFLPLHMLMHRLKVEEDARSARQIGNASSNVHIEGSKSEHRAGPWKKEAKKLCYNCRKEGHILKFCPEIKN